MAISRAQLRNLLLPGLYNITGQYPSLPKRWSEIFDERTSRMATERSVEMRYTGLADLKGEGANTTFDNAPGERFVFNIEHTAIGLGFAITREAIDDNLYKDAFNPQALGLMRSFNQTKEIMAANVLNRSNVYNSQIVGDGKALIATDHPIDNGSYANKPTIEMELNEASLEVALASIRMFPDQAGMLSMQRGEKLVVPLQLQWAAERLTKTQLRVGTNNNDVNAIVTTGALPKGYVVNEFLTSPTAWFILTDINGLVHFQRKPFEMDIHVDPHSGNLLVLGYERFGLGYDNPRAIWGTFPV